ncbi:glycosyltransferase family A protein [Vibrio splendidus]
MKIVSIITPVYNEEKNIKCCFDVVNNLDIPKQWDLEWVVINDGSTDNSLSILQDISNSCELKISIIDQPNSGAASARKKGIEQCSGDYIIILDCDDELSADSLNCINYELEKRPESDIVLFDVSYTKDEIVTSEFEFLNDFWPIDGKSAFKLCISDWGLPGWFFIKKRVMLQAISMKEQLTGQGNNITDDELVTRFCLYISEEIVKSNGRYFYNFNENSTTKRVNSQYFLVSKISLTLDAFIKENCKDCLSLSNENLVNTFIDLACRKRDWKGKIENERDWIYAISKTLEAINTHQYLLSGSVSLKRKLRFAKHLLLWK